jgi:hypothetical protein
LLRSYCLKLRFSLNWRDKASERSGKFEIATYTADANDSFCDVEVYIFVAEILHIVDFDELIYTRGHFRTAKVKSVGCELDRRLSCQLAGV